MCLHAQASASIRGCSRVVLRLVYDVSTRLKMADGDPVSHLFYPSLSFRLLLLLLLLFPGQRPSPTMLLFARLRLLVIAQSRCYFYFYFILGGGDELATGFRCFGGGTRLRQRLPIDALLEYKRAWAGG